MLPNLIEFFTLLRYSSLALLLGLCFGHSVAQELNFINYSSQNGLPSNEVYQMFQDSNGFLWMGTDRGIVRYDGNSFESYSIEDGLTGSTVFQFFPQQNGDIWCTTYNNRLFVFNPSDYRFRPYPFNDSITKYSSYTYCNDLYIDAADNFYLSLENSLGALIITHDGKVECRPSIPSSNVSIIQEITPIGDEFHYIAAQTPKRLFLPNSKAVAFQQISLSSIYRVLHANGTSIFASSNQISLLDVQSNLKTTITSAGYIVGLGLFDEHHFWVGFTKGGIGIYTMEGDLVHRFLQGHTVSDCFRDHQNGIWISTVGSGVFYAKSEDVFSHQFSPNYITALGQSLEGQLFVSLLYGDLYAGNSGGFQLICEGHNHHNNLASKNDYINRDVVFCNIATSFLDQPTKYKMTIKVLSEDFSKPLLFAGNSSLYYYQNDDIKKITTKHKVNCVGWAKNGIYTGTNNGLFLYDTLMGTNDRFPHAELDIRIQDLEVAEHCIYVGTKGKGLVRFQNNTATSIEKKHGLTSNLINSLMLENDSVVWVATNKGLNRITWQSDTFSIDKWTNEDMLIDNDISDIELINDTVWVGTRSGLCSFPKALLDQPKDSSHLFLRWTSFWVNDEENETQSLAELNHDQNKLTLQFSAVEFAQASKLQFRYRLLGLEEAWNYTRERQLQYAALPAGSFKVLLQASTTGENWEQNQLELEISIHPPFYQTAWFKLFGFLMIGGMVYLFFRLRVLSYNREILRELLRYLLKKVKPNTNHFLVKEQGKLVKISSNEVLFAKSSGNYLEIHTSEKKHLIRCKLNEFPNLVPDKIEYLRINRSYTIRIDKIRSKGSKTLMVGSTEIPIGKTYQSSISRLEL